MGQTACINMKDEHFCSVYIAASFRHLHGVRLLGRELERLGCTILDWTAKATPPPGLTPQQRRTWMDTDIEGGQVYNFCKNACCQADIVIYYGSSGQDAGVEVGMASASGVPILGIRGPLEAPGLMLHGAVTAWIEDTAQTIKIMKQLLNIKSANWSGIEQVNSPEVKILAEKMKANSERFNF